MNRFLLQVTAELSNITSHTSTGFVFTYCKLIVPDSTFYVLLCQVGGEELLKSRIGKDDGRHSRTYGILSFFPHEISYNSPLVKESTFSVFSKRDLSNLPDSEE